MEREDTFFVWLPKSPLITVGHEPGTEARRVGQLSQVGAGDWTRLPLDWVLASLRPQFFVTSTTLTHNVVRERFIEKRKKKNL